MPVVTRLTPIAGHFHLHQPRMKPELVRAGTQKLAGDFIRGTRDCRPKLTLDRVRVLVLKHIDLVPIDRRSDKLLVTLIQFGEE